MYFREGDARLRWKFQNLKPQTEEYDPRKTSYNVISANLLTKVKDNAKAFASSMSLSPIAVA